MSEESIDIGGNPTGTPPTPDQIAQVRESLGVGTVYSVTNAQRLAGVRGDGTTPLLVGDIVKVTNQGDRIEQYLGGADFTNPNWLVLEDTAELIINMSGVMAGAVFNGVLVEYPNTVNVGWFKVRDGVEVSDSSGLFGANSAILLSVLPSGFLSAYPAYSVMTGMTESEGHANPLTRLIVSIPIAPRSTITAIIQ